MAKPEPYMPSDFQSFIVWNAAAQARLRARITAIESDPNFEGEVAALRADLVALNIQMNLRCSQERKLA
ncbi:MAG TPA: hypothetical protein VFI23_03685 [Rhizomicrobium sp.]|nr:hypothetical protein [Rhizomicrobium sp.]